VITGGGHGPRVRITMSLVVEADAQHDGPVGQEMPRTGPSPFGSDADLQSVPPSVVLTMAPDDPVADDPVAVAVQSPPVTQQSEVLAHETAFRFPRCLGVLWTLQCFPPLVVARMIPETAARSTPTAQQ
jgi:hypothetical protein